MDNDEEKRAVAGVEFPQENVNSPVSSSLLSSASERDRRSHFIASTKVIGNSADQDFNVLFTLAKEAIRGGIHPELITEGSSGSYFVKDLQGKIVGVFKPKDEEPFAPLNPKWPKFFQRIMCFCCFGRACLIPNAGYLSETGASVVDERLKLRVVPKTRVVKLASPSFFYERHICFCCCSRSLNPDKLRPKEGSFQTFVNGYEPADRVIARWEYDPSLLNESERKRFILLFQRMIVLDYVIRNTDRHNDNWLIRHIPGRELELAAIDNGLAFPVKHPEVASRLRQFPFKWQTLIYAQEGWDEGLRRQLLERLKPREVHELCKEIKTLFRHDIAVNRPLVYNQLRVMRGQLMNLRLALEQNLTPAQMAKMEPLLVKRRYRRNNPPPVNANPSNWNQYFKSRSAWTESGGCCACASAPQMPAVSHSPGSPSPLHTSQPLPHSTPQQSLPFTPITTRQQSKSPSNSGDSNRREGSKDSQRAEPVAVHKTQVSLLSAEKVEVQEQATQTEGVV